jgi:hypothetical protein
MRWFILPLLLAAACMESADLADAKMRPFSDTYSVDRESLGLSALPRNGSVAIEQPSAIRAREVGYDAMLHFPGPTGRTIAFERAGSRYRWLGEQEMTFGPREYETADGKQREFIAVTYYRHAVFGQPAGLRIEYWGPDEHLAGRANLTLTDVQPLLQVWRQRH